MYTWASVDYLPICVSVWSMVQWYLFLLICAQLIIHLKPLLYVSLIVFFFLWGLLFHFCGACFLKMTHFMVWHVCVCACVVCFCTCLCWVYYQLSFFHCRGWWTNRRKEVWTHVYCSSIFIFVRRLILVCLNSYTSVIALFTQLQPFFSWCLTSIQSIFWQDM